MDAATLRLKEKEVDARNEHAADITKEIIINDEVYLVPYRKFFFVANINHGIARDFGVLPAEIPFRFRFHRARMEYVLLKISDTVRATTKADTDTVIDLKFSYPEPVVPFINPILRCYYAYSQDLNTRMTRIASHDFSMDFLHYECRQQILDTSLDEYTIPLGQGPLPKNITFALSTLDRSRGNETQSLTRFCQLDLLQFDLILSKF